MAGKKREDVREEDVTGLKYFDKLAPHSPCFPLHHLLSAIYLTIGDRLAQFQA